MKKYILLIVGGAIFACLSTSCDPKPPAQELTEEHYAGGLNGTAFNRTSLAYEQPAPAVTNMGAFKRGEKMFENNFVTGEGTPFSGLGPVYIRSSCIDCHPGYGRSKRVQSFNSSEYGNGYLIMIHTPEGKFHPDYTGMVQTRAVEPYKPPINEAGINITWHDYTDKYGNKYPDGTSYKLIYPTVSIEPSAAMFPLDGYQVSIEGTIGIYGTGLLDAITDADLIAEYNTQQARGYAAGRIGPMIKEADGTEHPGRYTYGLTRGTLQNGPGSNALWNITNVTRPDRKALYATKAWVEKMGELGLDTTGFIGGTNNPEMTMAEFDDFMIWHRGLAVPAARDLEDPEVQAGKEIFYEIGCTACHKPSWITGTDKYISGYSNQKIWPYTDLLQHNLGMKEPGLREWCRTTPLWGRGLSYICAGHTDMLHDLRARNYEEAILWHFGDAERCRESFRNLSKADRHNLVRFLESI